MTIFLQVIIIERSIIVQGFYTISVKAYRRVLRKENAGKTRAWVKFRATGIPDLEEEII